MDVSLVVYQTKWAFTPVGTFFLMKIYDFFYLDTVIRKLNEAEFL